MAKKQLTKTYYVSDFSDKDEIATRVVYPTGKHATALEAKGMEMEAEFPNWLGSKQSGIKVPVDPEYHDGKLELVLRLTKGNEIWELEAPITLSNPVKIEEKLTTKKQIAKRIQ